MKPKISTKNKPQKGLLKSMKKTGGRNKQGRITSRHRGGGSKRHYRVIEFAQEKLGEKAKIISLEYDPNRTCYIALIEYEDKTRKYILAPDKVKVGDELIFDEKTPLNIGNRMMLKNIIVGTIVYNIELEKGRGGKMVRSAGTGAQIMAHEGKYTHLKMPSTETRKVKSECFASIGSLSNPEHRFKKLKKAGDSRHKGIRPRVRGAAMNPVDHPHGGGEGRVGIGMKYPKTPWGKHALGVKTRKKKKWTNKLIVERRK